MSGFSSNSTTTPILKQQESLTSDENSPSEEFLSQYMEERCNSQPHILSGNTHEWKTKLPSGSSHGIVQYMISLTSGDEIMQQTYKVFETELRLFFRTRTGCWYRAAFIQAIVELELFDVPTTIRENVAFTSQSCVSQLLVPIFVFSRIWAVLKNPATKALIDKPKWVDHQTLTWLVRSLLPLKDYVPKIFSKDHGDDVDVLAVLSLAAQSRMFSQLLKGVVFAGSNPVNANAALCQQICGAEMLSGFFGRVEEKGVIQVADFPIRELGAYKHLKNIGNEFFGFENQMLASLWKAAEVPGKVGDFVDTAKDVLVENRDDVKAVVQSTRESAEQVKGLLGRLEEVLAPAFAMFSSLQQQGAKVAGFFKIIWKMMMDHSKIMFPIFSFVVVMAVRQFVGPQLATILASILGMIAIFMYGPTVAKLFSSFIQKLFRMNPPEDAQKDDDADDDEEFEPQAGDDIVVLITSMYLAAGVDPNKKKDVVEAFKAIPSMSKGVELVYNAILNFFTKISSFTSSFFGVEAEFADWLDEKYGKWLKVTLDYMSKQKASMLDATNLGADALLEHINVGLEISSDFESVGKRGLASLMVQNIKNLQNIHAELTSISATGPKDRAEPVCIMLCGEPGHGKSTLALLLAHILVRADFANDPPLLEAFEKDPKRFIHQRGIDKWFEAYHPDTRVLIRDEFPATKETTPEDSPYAQLLDEIGVNAKPLPMANADLKGKIYYNHAYSLITSNKQQFLSQMLGSPEAIGRRLHIVVDVSSKGVANHKKGETVDVKNWRLTLMNLMDAKSVSFQKGSTEITFEELVTLAVGIRNMRQNLLRHNTKNMTQLAKEVSARVDSSLYSIARNDYKMEFKRLPTQEELIDHIRVNAKSWEETGVEKAAIEALISSLRVNKGKDKIVEVKQDYKTKIEDVPEELVYPSMVNQAGGLEALDKAFENDRVPGTRTAREDDLFEEFVDFMQDAMKNPKNKGKKKFQEILVTDDATAAQLGPLQPFSIEQMIYFCKAVKDPYTIVVDALSTRLVQKMQWIKQKPQLEDKANVDITINWMSEYASGPRYAYARFAERMAMTVATAGVEGRQVYRIELVLGVLATFGKVRLFGYPIPWVETFANQKVTAMLACNNFGVDKNIVVPMTVTETTTIGPLSFGARLLTQFLQVAGIGWVFEYDYKTFSDFYFSDTHVLLYTYQFTQFMVDKIKRMGDALFQAAKAWASGRMTVFEAARFAFDGVAPVIKETYKQCAEYLIDATASSVNVLKETIRGAIQALKKYWLEITGALSIVAAAVAAYKMYSSGVSAHENQNESLYEDFSEQDSSMQHNKYLEREARSRKSRIVKAKNPGSNAEQATVHYVENVAETLRRNMWWQLGPGGKPIGTWLFIEKTRAMAPAHFLLAARDAWHDDDTYITLAKGSQKYNFKKSEVVVVADLLPSGRDLVIVDFLCPQFPPQRNIKNHFASPKDESLSVYRTAFRIDLFTLQRCVTDDAYNDEQVLVRESENSRVATELFLKDRQVRKNVITYAIPTVAGECGSIVVFKGKIIGIHAHGNGSLGSATRVNAALLEASYAHPESEEALPMSEFESFEYDRGGMGENQNYDEDVHSGIRVGVLDPPMNTFVTSSFVEWNKNDELKPTVIPVNATIRNYPVARAKYGFKPYDIDPEVRDLAVMAYKTYLLRLMKPSTFRRNLTFDEAVAGVPGTSIKSLDNTTSPGFPYNYDHVKRDQIYKIDESGHLVKGPLWPRLVSDAQADVRLMCHDYTPAYVYSDNLKMELRAPEKVDKPRMIAGAPLAHTFLARIHFGAFMAFMSDNNGLNDMLIGADPHVDWDFYQRKMTSVSDGERECFGDFSGFDTSRAPEMMDFVAEIANSFYGDADDSPVGKVRHQLVRSCIVSVHMYAKVLEQVSYGWCSGALLTGLGNSMFNTWAHVYAAVKYAKDLGEDYHLVAAEYFNNVYLKVMGDDCGMGVSEEYSFHNNATIAQIVGRDLALTYTSVKKSVDVVPFDPAEDRTLLKRESIFCNEDGVYYGCLQMEVILNMVCYTKKGDELTVMRQRGDNAIKELSFRPSSDWDKFLPIILRKLGPLYVYRGSSQKETRRACLIGWFTQGEEPTPDVVKLVNGTTIVPDLEANMTSLSLRSSPSESIYERSGCNTQAARQEY